MSSLHASVEAYAALYRRQGWLSVPVEYRHALLHVPAAPPVPSPDTHVARLADLDHDAPQLHALHEQLVARVSGPLRRTPEYWRRWIAAECTDGPRSLQCSHLTPHRAGCRASLWGLRRGGVLAAYVALRSRPAPTGGSMLLLSECAFAPDEDPAAALAQLLPVGAAHHRAQGWAEPGTAVRAPRHRWALMRVQLVFPAALLDPQWVAPLVDGPVGKTTDLGLQYRVLNPARLGMTDAQLAVALCSAAPPAPWHHSSHVFLNLDAF